MKQRNVETAIEGFESLGVPLSFDKAAVTGVRGSSGSSTITAKDICAGHRDKTTALRWSIMSHWQLPTLIDSGRLTREARIIRTVYGRCNDTLAALEREIGAAGTPPAATSVSVG